MVGWRVNSTSQGGGQVVGGSSTGSQYLRRRYMDAEPLASKTRNRHSAQDSMRLAISSIIAVLLGGDEQGR